MATTKTANVRQKLAQARLMFLNKNVKKTGKNNSLEFKYFELEDIVPSAIEIFAEIGLVTTTNFDSENASMTVFNTDNMDESGMVFSIPYRDAGQIISKTGKQVTNPVQALGASVTYLRRYLYMMALDIVEHDDIDATLGAVNTEDEETPAPVKTQKAPATPSERKAAKKELTSSDGAASDEQLNELKAFCKALLEKDETQEDFIQQIAMKTNGFTTITASACTALNQNLAEILAQYGDQ